MKLEPIVLPEELYGVRELPSAVGEAYAETDQPLLRYPRARHEDLSFEQAIYREPGVVLTQDRPGVHLADSFYGLYRFQEKSCVGGPHRFK
jgi:hypothetical protein